MVQKTPCSVKVRANCGLTAIARGSPRQHSRAWLAVESPSSVFRVHKNATRLLSTNFNPKSSPLESKYSRAASRALDTVRDPGSSSAIASLMEEVQLLRDKETKNTETWSKVVRKGKGKGKGKSVAVHQVSLWNVQKLMTLSAQPVMPLMLPGNEFPWKTAERFGVL